MSIPPSASVAGGAQPPASEALVIYTYEYVVYVYSWRITALGARLSAQAPVWRLRSYQQGQTVVAVAVAAVGEPEFSRRWRSVPRGRSGRQR